MLVSMATISWSAPLLMGSSAGGHIFDMDVSFSEEMGRRKRTRCILTC